jgi:ATP-binding cassette, subfamily B (MDR/TAP), member 1
MTIVLGSITQIFIEAEQEGTLSAAAQKKINDRALYFIFLAIAVGLGNFVSLVSWNYSGLNIITRTRTKYFESVLKQDITFLDGISAAEITAQLGNDFDSMQEGVSEKIGFTLFSLSTFVSSFIIAFWRNWKLAAIMASVVPAMFIPTVLLSMYASRASRIITVFSTEAFATAEEVLLSIRMAQSLGLPNMLLGKFDNSLKLSENAAQKKILAQNVLLGNIHFIVFAAYALAFWEGSRLLMKGEIEIGGVVNVLFVIIIGSFALGQTLRQIQTFGNSIASGQQILEMIDRKTEIDAEGLEDNIPLDTKGDIVFSNVRFAYPGRPDVFVLDGFNLNIEPGKTTAIVGLSGSGKSTVTHLLNRLYDPYSGEILLDGIDVRQYSVSAVRAYSALVPQDCVMFSKSIADNIFDGIPESIREHHASIAYMDQIIEACKLAGAHEFIGQFPDQYHTIIGPQGISLSGGQVQRLSIARAIVGNPKLLLLDEATSALDAVSEERISSLIHEQRRSLAATTVIIAHKLSTVKCADKIVFVEKGKVIEEGTHEELLRKRGAYYRLLETNTQNVHNLRADHEPGTYLATPCHSAFSSSQTLTNYESDFEGAFKNEFTLELYHTEDKRDMLLSEKPLLGESVSLPRCLHFLGRSIELMKFNKHEPWMAFAFVGSIILGATYPAQTVIFAKLILHFADRIESSGWQTRTNLFCIYFLVIAFCKGIVHVITTMMFGICNERMVGRIRRSIFDRMSRSDISWFEKDNHGVPTLQSTLENVSQLQTFHCGTWSIYVAIAVNLIAGIALSFAFAWQLALVSTSIIPVYILTAFVRYKFLSVFQSNIKAQNAASTAFACEAASSFRTVVTLGIQNSLAQRYSEILWATQPKAFINNLRASAVFSTSQSITYLANALLILYGAKLTSEGKIDVFGFFVCLISVLFVAQDVSELFTHNPNRAGASDFYKQLTKLVGTFRVQKHGFDHNRQEKGSGSAMSVDFQNVTFAYPGRPEKPILKGLDLSIKSGQYVAFVGASGQGKSTIVNLLQGFYHEPSGKILIDGHNLQDMDIYTHRKSIGYVCQEPSIFDGTVRFNILLGLDQPDVPFSVLEEACRTANILDFINSLPEGFETQCGRKGVNISGGQKQRIVIARALIRNPRILLLDEATSALDYSSEMQVREGLSRVRRERGMTVLAIAHRLSTVRDADVICVLQDGVIVEKGRHEELLDRDGLYGRFYESQ